MSDTAGIDPYSMGVIYTIRGYPQKALHHLRTAAQLAGDARPRFRLRCQIALAQALNDVGRTDEAAELLFDVILESRRKGWKLSQLNGLSLLGFVKYQTGELSISREHHESAVKLIDEIEKEVATGVTYEQLGSLAGELFERGSQAAEMLNELGHEFHGLKFDAFVNASITNMELGRLETAWKLLEKAESCPNPESDLAQAQLRLHRGNVCFVRSEYPDALRYYEAASPYFKEHGPVDADLSITFGIANVLSATHKHRDARKVFKKGLEDAKKHGLARKVAQASLSIGVCYRHTEEVDNAIRYYGEARSAFEGCNDMMGVGKSCTNLGSAYLQKVKLEKKGGDLAEASACAGRAVAYFELARTIHEGREYRYGIIHALFGMGLAKQALGHYTEAIALLEESISKARVWNYTEEEMDYLIGLGTVNLNLDRGDDALVCFDQAINLLNENRLSVRKGGETFEMSWLEGRDQVYGLALECCLRQREKCETADEKHILTERCWKYIEDAKSRILVCMMNDKPPALGSGADSALQTVYHELWKTQNRLGGLQADRYKREVGGRESQIRDEEIRNCKSRLDEILAQIQLTFPEVYQLLRVDTAPLSAAVEFLDDETVILTFLSLKEALIACVLDREHGVVIVEELALGSIALEKLVEGCLPGAAMAHGLSAASRSLLPDSLRKALQLEADQTSYRRIVIIPHGFLHRLPFAALPIEQDGERCLIDRFDKGIVHAPSMTSLMMCCEKNREHGYPDRILILANPTGDLKHAQSEGRFIKGLFASSGTLYENEEATKAVLDSIPKHVALHIASHGKHVASDPMSSYVRLADAFYSVRDAYELSIQATIVVLSACLVGRSEAKAGDELIGMMRGWFFAGTTTLVSGLWEVNDESTARFMERFYINWQACGDKAQGLQMAMMDLRMESCYHDPYYWAPFFISGAWL